MTAFSTTEDLEVAVAEASLSETLTALHALGPALGLAKFAASLDPEWIDAALQATGTASIRRRKCPADRVIWTILGASLFADRSIDEVARDFGVEFPGVQSLAKSAVTQARYRVGPEPLRWLFQKVADTWKDSPGLGGYKSLTLYGIDGTHLRVPDSQANSDHFGRPGGRAGSGDSGYPQARVVVLLNLSNRIIAGAEIGRLKEGELGLSVPLSDDITDNSLTIVDRGFNSYPWIHEITKNGSNRHAMVRAKKNLKFRIDDILEDGTALAALEPRSEILSEYPGIAAEIPIRVIEYRYPDSKETTRLFVTLLDAKKYPAKELIALYHQRWELEIAFDELKTHMLERKECLRSQKPEGIMQEIWAQLLTYNLVRREMLLVANEKKVSANRVSFRTSLLYIRDFWLVAGMTRAPGNIPKNLAFLEKDLTRLILPERRSDRRYPRHVKIKMSNYPRNRGRSKPAETPEKWEESAK